MKKLISTLFCVALGSCLVFAQGNAPKAAFSKKATLAKAPAKAYTGFETWAGQPSVPVAENSLMDVIVGNTVYDLQSNASIPSRLIQHPDGRLSGVWTQSLGDAAGPYPDRGSGYNTSDANHVWGPTPGDRVENVRCGFTNIVATSDGKEHVISHNGSGQIQVVTNDNGTWTQQGIAHQSNPGGFWARAAASGNTIHVIYLTMPTGNGGVPVDGLDGQVLYHRSTDGGATWDIIDGRLPGVDSIRYNGVSAEDYAIHANGDNVSIGIFAQNGDVLCITSNDNGSTWTNNIVYDFYDKFTWGDEYDTTAIIACHDTNFYPAPTAYMTSAGHGDIYVDGNGMTHLVFSSMFMTDDDFSDDQASIFNGWDIGVLYWNTSMATITMCDAPNFVQAAFTPDLNADGVLGTTGVDIYTEYRYDCISAQPTLGMDADGRLWCGFNGINELDVNLTTNSYFRKGFVTASNPNDFTTWNPDASPINLSYNSDGTLTPFQEHLYFAISKNVGADSLYFLGHVDYNQGTNLNQSTTDNTQVQYYAVAKTEVPEVVSTKQVVRNDIAVSITPNPAAFRTQLTFDLKAGVRGNITVLDVNGKVVSRTTTQNFNSGQNSLWLDVANLANGLYMVQLNTEEFISTQRLVVANR